MVRRPQLLAMAMVLAAPLLTGCPKTYDPNMKSEPNPPGEKGEVTSPTDPTTGNTDAMKETAGK